MAYYGSQAMNADHLEKSDRFDSDRYDHDMHYAYAYDAYHCHYFNASSVLSRCLISHYHNIVIHQRVTFRKAYFTSISYQSFQLQEQQSNNHIIIDNHIVIDSIVVTGGRTLSSLQLACCHSSFIQSYDAESK